MLSLLLAAIFFAGVHLGVAGTTIRDRAIAALGQSGYRVAFSIATVVGLAWLVTAYNRAPYMVTWGMLEWWKPVGKAADVQGFPGEPRDLGQLSLREEPISDSPLIEDFNGA